MQSHLAGLGKILRLCQVRIQATKFEIASKSNTRRKLETRLTAIPIEIEEIEQHSRRQEQERLRSLLGKSVLPLDLLKLQLIRSKTEGEKSRLAAEAMDITHELQTIVQALEHLSKRLARLLKREHQLAAVCANLTSSLSMKDNLAEERTITERL